MFRWPDRENVLAAARAWAAAQFERDGKLIRIGVFGSQARGECGVGSDLDLIAIVRGSEEPFERRALAFDLLELPVPADLLVYTEEEWERSRCAGSRFAETVEREAIWFER